MGRPRLDTNTIFPQPTKIKNVAIGKKQENRGYGRPMRIKLCIDRGRSNECGKKGRKKKKKGENFGAETNGKFLISRIAIRAKICVLPVKEKSDMSKVPWEMREKQKRENNEFHRQCLKPRVKKGRKIFAVIGMKKKGGVVHSSGIIKRHAQKTSHRKAAWAKFSGPAVCGTVKKNKDRIQAALDLHKESK